MRADSKVKADFFSYQGRSMWPIFQEGDLLEVRPVILQELRVGDCLTYRLNDSETLVTHRVRDIRGGLILTHGDAFPWPDDLSVSEKQIVGRVISRFRLGCFKRVQGGITGQLAGRFYHYAGRLDPQRDGRCGRAARLLRGSLQWLAAGLYRRGIVREFSSVEREGNRYWQVGQRPCASFDHAQGCWRVPWPQSLLIDPTRL